jgi:serine/threonine protein kinase
MKLIKKMLTYNATDRLSAEEALHDEWIYQQTAMGP